MEKSVFEVVKAPLGWSVFADNVKIGGVYDSRGAALEAAALAASYTIKDHDGESRSTWRLPSCHRRARAKALSEAASGTRGSAR